MRLLALCLLLASSAPLAAQATGTLGDPLLLDVATSLRGHNSRSPINLSPDGQWIAHTIRSAETVPLDSIGRRYSATGFAFAEGDARMEATLSSTRTDEVIRLGTAASASWAPVWSPDGNRVAFYSDEGGTAGIWVWERSTRTATRVPGLIVRPYFGFETVQWAADSRRLLVKVIPAGMTIAQANAREGTGRTAPVVLVARPDEPAVVVRRFDPRASAADTARDPASSPAIAPQLRWAEVDLVVVDLRDGSVQRLVESTPVRAYAFSPDERHVAYTISKGAEPNTQQPLFDLVAQEIATGFRRTLAGNTKFAYGIEWSWSPNGRTIAQIASGQQAAGDIVIYDVSTGTARSLASSDLPSFDPDDGEYPPLWDARSENLYAAGGGALWRIDAASGRGTRVGQLDGWRIRSPVWRHGSSTLWTTDGGRTAWVIGRARDGGDAGILHVDLTTGRTRVALREPKGYSAVFNLAASDARREIAFVSGGQRALGEIWMFDTRNSRVRRASSINADLNRYQLGHARVIEWQTADGEALRGALLLPPGYLPGTRVPLVVYVYGGDRGSNFVNRFGLLGSVANLNMHILATRGYAVLYPDAPLREGQAMADLMRTVMPGVDAAIAQGFADSDRLAIMGQSYGSYNTLAIITQTNRFKAAVITAAVLHPDLFTDYLRNIGYYERGQGNMGGSIWEQHDRYLANSPLFHFNKIETPVLIGQGERDGDLAPSEAIFTALQRLRKPVEYRLYRGEGHVITQRPNVIDFWNRRLEFLAEHLDIATDARGAVLFENGRAKRRPATSAIQ